MKIVKDFGDFISKGNVIDLAVAVVIGAAFGTITKSLVADIIMPPIGLLLGGVDFTNLMIVLQAATADTEAVAIRYGAFLQTVINFLIIAAAVFVIVRMYKKLEERRAKEEVVAPTTPPKEEQLLTEIRDLLKKK